MRLAWLSLITLGLLAASPVWDATAKLKDNFFPTQVPELKIRKQPATIQAKNLSVEEISRKVTVRIIAGSNAGSGVIVERQGETYTVLTCEHVVDDNPGEGYKILTQDGATYTVESSSIVTLKGVDLALIQFKSRTVYEVVNLGDRETPKIGQQIYVAGFPNYRYKSPQEIESTLTWGPSSFRFASGKLSMILSDRSLPQGYQLGHTATIENGMSGGPILDKQGRLIGINGRGKNPVLLGDDAFIFEDGSTPSKAEIEQMEALSWAIPIKSLSGRTREPKKPDDPFSSGV